MLVLKVGDTRMNKVPHHLAIIMDGNRRWARQRGLVAVRGHRQGADTLKDIAREANNQNIRWLTAFAFSFENWSRPKPEIEGLMGLLRGFLENDIGELNDQNVKLRVIGNRERFGEKLVSLIDWAERSTSGNTGLNLTLALDYGGRQEIAAAVRMLASEVRSGILSVDDIREDVIKSRMTSAALPEIDLLIRTGGEQRVSNFMLWDISYAELYFSPVLWPDFGKDDLGAALDDFASRDRRFGGDTVESLGNRVTSIAEKRRSS